MLPFTERGEARTSDLEVEQAVVDAAYEHLARMRVKAERLLAEMTGVDVDLDWPWPAGRKRSGPRQGRCALGARTLRMRRRGISAGGTSRTKWVSR